MSMNGINDREVLKSVLLQVLLDYPDGAEIEMVYSAIRRDFKFPEEWDRLIPCGSGHKELSAKGIHWQLLTDEELTALVKTEPKWQNYMRWVKLNLKQKGYIDKTRRGIWRLSAAGFAAAKRSLQNLNAAERKIASRKSGGQQPSSSDQKSAKSQIDSRRRGLMEELQNLAVDLPVGCLDLLVEIGRAMKSRSISS